jgi:hypothetical protein
LELRQLALPAAKLSLKPRMAADADGTMDTAATAATTTAQRNIMMECSL